MPHALSSPALALALCLLAVPPPASCEGASTLWSPAAPPTTPPGREAAPAGPTAPPLAARCRRASLIAPFDISKMWRKKPTRASFPEPTPAPFRSERTSGVPPAGATRTVRGGPQMSATTRAPAGPGPVETLPAPAGGPQTLAEATRGEPPPVPVEEHDETVQPVKGQIDPVWPGKGQNETVWPLNEQNGTVVPVKDRDETLGPENGQSGPVLPMKQQNEKAWPEKSHNGMVWPVKSHNGTVWPVKSQNGTVWSVKSQNGTVWPVKRAATVHGDIILGGLMMVHSRSEVWTCGPVMAQGGVQALEAMLFALDHVARAHLAPPGVALGAHVLDDCDNDTYGLEMALDFIKGSISNIAETEQSCDPSGTGVGSGAGGGPPPYRQVISGVVGAASSVTSVQVANLLRLFKIPQVSFFSTSPELSNKARFEYFTRTIPSDLHQVRAMVEIVKRLGWRYVSIVYEESNYGIKAFEELETLLARNEICIAVKERLVKDSGEADERAYDAIVARLLSRPRARGVIVFGSDQEVAGVMAAVQRAGASRWFGWVGSDGWSARALVSRGNERAVEGTISVQPQANPVRGFKEYFLNLTVENNKRNPWFVEFWEDHFKCRHPSGARTPYNGGYAACSGRERLGAEGVEFEAQLQFVTDAVLAFAHALRDMHAELCGAGARGVCAAMRGARGATLLRHLRRVRFRGLGGDRFHFDANGDPPARYNILHYKRVAPRRYRWVRVGRYLDGELELRTDEIQFKWESPRVPSSVCSAECARGQARQYVEGSRCCWHCFNCTQYAVRAPRDETACEPCPAGTLPDARRERCAPVPELYLRAGSPAALGAMAFSALGMLLTLLVGGVWAARGRTPVVRASGRELSFVLLAGILLCYSVTFVLVARPTDALCAVQRFGTGLCFTVVYAALLTKTNRIARIFAASKRSARRPALISPNSQLLICAALVSIQVVVLAVWQAAAPARALRHHPTRADNMLVCDAYVDASYTIAFFYPVLLILTCTVYAVLTRNIPEAFNESKHIGFTMYTTCVIWLAFVPLYLGTAAHVPLRVTSMALTISLSASVTLVCLFAPKVYIIVFHPERNVRARLAGGGAGRGALAGAAGGAVCAALVGAAHAPPRDLATPSTDLSTLHDGPAERCARTDRLVQTEESAPRPAGGGALGNGLRLDARRLRELVPPPAAPPAAAPAPPGLGVAVAVVCAELPL